MPKILAIDGRLDNLAIPSDLLRNLIPNCAVITAQSGMEGIEKARAEDPDAILLDIGMPDMNGFEICRRLTSHESTKHIPVILAMATKANPDSRIEGLECGANAFLAKPIDEYELVSQVKVALRIRKAEDSLRERSDSLQQMVEERTASLRESEEHFRSLVESTSDWIWTIDAEGCYSYASPQVVNFLDYKPDEVLGKTPYDFMPQEEADRVRGILQDIFNARLPFKGLENLNIRKNGGSIVLETSGVPIFDAAGNFRGYQGINHDITERKRAEKALRESEAKFRLLAEESLAGVVIIQDGRFKYVNRAMARMAGYSQEEMLETTVLDLVAEEDRPLVRENIRRCLDEAIPSVVYDFRCRRQDGLEACFEVLGVRTMFENRLAVLSTLIDITDRKQAALQIQDTLYRLRKALSTTIQVMVSAVETRDPYTAGHQLRTADLSRAIATEVGLGPGQIDNIHMVSSIHDIGKLSIPAEILSKPSKLSKIEFAMIKEHAQRGYEILKDVESSWSLAEIVLQHHERMDGSGYPRNLKGEEILIEARILGVADVVESMASHRPYRPSLGIEMALEEIEENRGILYDNAVADACLRLFREKGYELTPQR